MISESYPFNFWYFVFKPEIDLIPIISGTIFIHPDSSSLFSFSSLSLSKKRRRNGWSRENIQGVQSVCLNHNYLPGFCTISWIGSCSHCLSGSNFLSCCEKFLQKEEHESGHLGHCPSGSHSVPGHRCLALFLDLVGVWRRWWLDDYLFLFFIPAAIFSFAALYVWLLSRYYWIKS